MNTHSDKTQEKKNQSVANEIYQKQISGEPTFQFVDNRPEAVVTGKLQEMANNSPRFKQLKSFQDIPDNGPQTKQVTQLVLPEKAQTSADMTQPNKALGVDENETLKETQDLSKEDLEAQVNQLMKNAAIAKDDFIALINRVLRKSGDKAQNGDPGFEHANKATQGAIDKAKGRMKGKTTGGLNDVLRGAIICDDMQTLIEVQGHLDNESISSFEQTGAQTQKKNGFEKSERKTAGDMVGYGDIKYIMPVVHYKSEGKQKDFWMYAEIQVMSHRMKSKKKKGGHSFYDITREAKHDSSSGTDMYIIKNTESSKSGAKALINEHIKHLEKGVNPKTLATLRPKLFKLIFGDDIELTDTEKNELEFAGELIYRKERLEGNLIAHGILKS